MSKTQVILVGGFLGAGKTTLLAKARERLAAQGKRVGLITNDQAANLVDTAILTQLGSPVQEVSGGCFCCRFDDLIGAMNRLVEAGMPDVLIGEPVGSCTDLSATVLQPVKEFYRDRFRMAPFSVLVDAREVRTLNRLGSAESVRFPGNVMYIYQKQLEEADLIVLNKADLLPADELAQIQESLRREFPQAHVMAISALHGAGVDAWLEHVQQTSGAGRTITEVDYDEYAEGEAALGWLNAAVLLRSDGGIDGRSFCLNLIRNMQREFQAVMAEVAHLKLHWTAGSGTFVANLTSSHGEPMLRGSADGSSREATLLVNVRAKIDPESLRTIAQQSIEQVAGTAVQAAIEDLQSFAPSRPQPTHRFARVV